MDFLVFRFNIRAVFCCRLFPKMDNCGYNIKKEEPLYRLFDISIYANGHH